MPAGMRGCCHCLWGITSGSPLPKASGGPGRAGNETLLVTPSVSPLLSSLRTAGRKREDRLKSKTREIALERQIHFMSRV